MTAVSQCSSTVMLPHFVNSMHIHGDSQKVLESLLCHNLLRSSDCRQLTLDVELDNADQFENALTD